MQVRSMYSVDEVLHILLQFWPNACGIDHVDPEFESMSIRDWDDWGMVTEWYFSRRHRTKLYRNGIERIFDVFGVCAADEELDRLAHRRATMRVIAEAIAQKAQRIELKPLNLLGRQCKPAGVFRTLKKLAQRASGHEVRIGPSTHLSDILTFEQQSQFMLYLTPAIPAWTDLDIFHREARVAGRLGTFAFMAFLIITAARAVTDHLLLDAIFLFLFGLFLAALFVDAAVRWLSNLIHGKTYFRRDIRTFGDLARVISSAT